MVYAIIGCAVVILAVLSYFAFFKKNKNFKSYKIEEEKQEVKEETAMQLNEEKENGMTIEDEFDIDPIQNSSSMEDDFDDLEDLFDDFSESDSNELDILDDYDYDSYNYEQDDDVKRSEIVNEIHKMSPKMKAIILADVLDRKYF